MRADGFKRRRGRQHAAQLASLRATLVDADAADASADGDSASVHHLAQRVMAAKAALEAALALARQEHAAERTRMETAQAESAAALADAVEAHARAEAALRERLETLQADHDRTAADLTAAVRAADAACAAVETRLAETNAYVSSSPPWS